MSAEPNGLQPSPQSTGLDPFVDDQGAKSYFVTPALRQRIDLVRHLLEFGRQIVVLTGVPAAGKSALLHRVSEPGEKNWRVLRYIAGPMLNRASLLRKIATELEIEGSVSGDEQLLESVRAHVRTGHQRGELMVMTIDDAHRLPADTTACITKLAHCVDEAAELKIVLSADPAQSALVEQLQSGSSIHALVHVVEVPRLNSEQVSAMLTHRWKAAYGTDEIPLDASAMAQVSQASAGVPGKAIVLARQVQILANSAQSPGRDPAQRYLIGGIACIVLFIIFAFFNFEKTDQIQETQIALPLEAPQQKSATKHNPSIAIPREPSALRSAPDKPSSETADTIVVTPVAEPLLPTATEISTEYPTDATPALALPLVSPEPPADAREDTSVIAPPKDAEPAPPSVATPIALPTVPAPLPAKAERTRAYSIEWLRTQAAAGYVLQLFGVRDRVAAVNFIRDRKISDHSAVLITYHENAPWYVVVYGYYTDRVAAQAAIVDLPGNLAATRPWARPIASLN